jgi:hypothetical protein
MCCEDLFYLALHFLLLMSSRIHLVKSYWVSPAITTDKNDPTTCRAANVRHL